MASKKQGHRWVFQKTGARYYTVNVNSKITDKLRYLTIISKQTHAFLNIFENCHNHTQMSVKV